MDTKKEASGLIALAFALIASLSLASCAIAPDNETLLELNRGGKWAEAERVGLDMLAHQRTFTHSQLCETYFNVVYAMVRQGKKVEATRFIGEYDGFKAGGSVDPGQYWVERELTKLKGELGLLGEVEVDLVSAMDANVKGDYRAALGLCGAALAAKGATQAQLAVAHFVAAVCSIRIEDAASAERHLAAFDSLKGFLPAGHLALAQEPTARRGLEELRGKR